MHFSGTRRARLISLLLSLLLLGSLWQLTRAYLTHVQRSLAPTLLARLRVALQRDIQVDRLQVDEPGLLIAEGVRVARGTTFRSGTLLTARRLEIRYNPLLLGWSSLISRGAGQDTRAEVEAEGIRVPHPGLARPRDFFRAASVKAELDFGPALRGHADQVVASIGTVDVRTAFLWLVRQKDGTWNYDEVLKLPKQQKPTLFRGEVRIADSVVELSDFRAGLLPAPAQNRARGSGTLRFAGYPVLQWQASGQVDGPQGGPFQFHGTDHAREKRWFVSLDAGTSDLRYWYRYVTLSRNETFDLLSGRGRARLTAWGRSGSTQSPHYMLGLDAADASARIHGLEQPLRQFRGHLSLDPALIAVDGETTVAATPVRISGEITRGDAPRADLRLSSSRLTVEALKRVFPKLPVPRGLTIPGAVPTQASITGEPGLWMIRGESTTPRVHLQDGILNRVAAGYELRIRDGVLESMTGHLTAARGQFRDLTGSGVRIDARSRGKVLELATQFATLGGKVAGNGWLDFTKEQPEYYLQGTLAHLDLERIPWKQEEHPELSGDLGGTFVAAGTLEEPRLAAMVRATPAALGSERVEELSARLRWSHGVLEIPSAVVRDNRGTVSLRGSVGETGKLDLYASAAGLEMARVLRNRVKQEVRGTAYLHAHVTGTTESPHVEAGVQVYHPAYGEETGDYFAAQVVARGLDQVELSNVELIRAPEHLRSERLELSRAGRAQPWNVAGDVTLEGASIVRLLRLAGVSLEKLEESPVAGELGPIRATLAGPLGQLRAQFTARATSVAALGLDLGEVSASGDVDLGARTVTLRDVSSASSLGSASVSGTLQWERPTKETPKELPLQADLRARVAGLHLGELVRRYAPELLHNVSLDGSLKQSELRITGRLDAPEIAATIELENLVVNERAITLAPFQVEWSRGAAVVRDLQARVGSGRVKAPYLALLLDPAASDRPLLQRLTGSLEVERLPILVARQLLEDSPYFRTPAADSLREILALWRSPVAGEISAEVQIADGAGVPSPSEAARRLLARTGPPVVTASLRIPDLVSPPGSDQPPVQLTASAVAQGRQLELKELRLQQEGGALVTVSGLREVIDPKQPATLRFAAKATRVPLRSLASLPIADLRERVAQLQPLDGILELQAELSGTDAAPMARFSLEIDQPVLSGIPFDRLHLARGEYDGQAGELRIAESSVTKRLGGEEAASVQLSGLLPIKWPELSISRTAPRRLSVEVPEQSLKVFTTLAEDAEAYAAKNGATVSPRVRSLISTFRQVAATEGRMQGNVTLAGTIAQPRNSGSIGLTGATFRIDGLQTAIRNFSARLELAGDVVRVAEFHGESSQGGSFNGGGEVRLARGSNGQPTPDLNLSLDVDNFRLVEKQLGSVLGEAFVGSQLTATLTTVNPVTPEKSRPLAIRGEWPSPTVEGGVRLDKTNFVLAYENRGTPPDTTMPLDLRLNVRLIAGKEVWLRNPQLRLKIGGSVLASNTTREPVLSGELPISQGSFLLSGLRLRNAEGIIRVAWDRRAHDLGVAPPPPVFVDIEASTSLRVHRTVSDEAEYYETTFEIRGTPGGSGTDSGIRQAGVASGLSVGSDSGLTLTIRTDPPLPSREIEALIRQQFGVEGFSGSGANVVEALRGQIEQAFAVNVASALAGRIEDVLQSALGLNTLSLDLGITQPLRVRLGKQLFGPVYGTVTQEFGGVDSQRQFEVYYRLSPRFHIGKFNPQLRIGYRREDPSGRRTIFFSGTASF